MALGLAHPLPLSLTLSSDSGTSLRKLFSSLYSFPIVNVCGPLDLTRLLTTHPPLLQGTQYYFDGFLHHRESRLREDKLLPRGRMVWE